MLIRRFFALMDEAGAGAGEGGGAGAGGSDGGAGVEGGAQADPGSLLAGGAGQPTEFIPEKYRVMNADGALDLEASSRKLADAYTAAEKRIGSGDIPPKSAEEYTVAVPDAFKETFDPKADEGFKAFSGKMHELGLTQKQMDGVMEQYFTMAPQLVAGAAILDANAIKDDLTKEWASKGGFDHQIRLSYQGAAALAQKAGMNIDELMQPNRLGNNKDFLKLMAAIGPEFAEDTSSGGTSMGGASSEDQINELMRGEAYQNPRHADHDKVSKQVRAFFERKHGTAAVG
ncbi:MULTISPECIES: hypothetical protein [unclassified Cupriavidus]|uniref:hypothetical protein n=1 Tax=unclassified Cupriavidus TaxID=2640874 RepID=UPI001BFFECCC|nr:MULTISPECIES: hypothetical protein [unclassified Cupriavidus]MCA3188321.1 hypothetical protein [Cupriavidus sp.]MCA3189825.1 hypothetical protein [Cupriavidus sp.]MCA3196419.1 hypothetical protein [Cupriavidus sp.]MCA3202164.1 hypothetical protein [Cupriavidus sp.]MCA3232180.1 hypothetical protein [Cupriavidus sp.]